MSFKYYSIMRPVCIGTFPGKPKSIRSYDRLSPVVTADGVTIWAWGELEYEKPLTEYEAGRYELRGDYEFAPFKHVGYWMNNGMLEIIRINGKYYVLNGWNGTDYGHCWECLSKTQMAEPNVEYTLTPVLYADTPAGQALMDTMYNMDEDSDEWNAAQDKLHETVSYTVTEN